MDKKYSHANKMAELLADSLSKFPGAKLMCPVQSNEIFIEMPDTVAAHLRVHGAQFYDWGFEGSRQYRFVTSFNTDLAEVLKIGELTRTVA